MEDEDVFSPQQGVPPPPPGGAQTPGLIQQWGSALANPSFRASLISFGAQLMQPMGFGQSPLGHLGRAIGAGGEAATAYEEQELKESLAKQKSQYQDATLGIARERLGVSKENAETRRIAATNKSTGGLTASQILRARQQRKRQMEVDAYKEAKAIVDQQLLDPGNPSIQRFAGKSVGDIARELMADPKWNQRYQPETPTVVATPQQLPPLEQRQPGKTMIQTPRGLMMWNGRGWTPFSGGTAPTSPMVDPDDEDETEEV